MVHGGGALDLSRVLPDCRMPLAIAQGNPHALLKTLGTTRILPWKQSTANRSLEQLL